MSISQLKIEKNNLINTFTTTYNIPFLYSNEPNIVNFDFIEPGNENNDISLFETSTWFYINNKIPIIKFLEENTLIIQDTISSDDSIIRNFQYNVDYFKCRVKSYTIQRGLLYDENKAEIPEDDLPDFNHSPCNFYVNFTVKENIDDEELQENLIFTNIGAIINKEGFTNANPIMIESCNVPTQWLNFNEKFIELTFNFGLDILYYNEKENSTYLESFLSQRFKSISFELEFEYKKVEINNPTADNIITQDITMENLYKMMESFFKQRAINIKNKAKIDGIDENLIDEISSKGKKKKGIYIQEPFSKDEIEFFINKVISTMSNPTL